MVYVTHFEEYWWQTRSGLKRFFFFLNNTNKFQVMEMIAFWYFLLLTLNSRHHTLLWGHWCWIPEFYNTSDLAESGGGALPNSYFFVRRRAEFNSANKVIPICIFITHPSILQVWLSFLGQSYSVNGYAVPLKGYLSPLKNLIAKS